MTCWMLESSSSWSYEVFVYHLFNLLCTFLQRGTGLSTPLTVSSMSQFKSADELADYLKHFRADNIVNDAEFIRVRLVPDAGPWTILGQVFALLLPIGIHVNRYFDAYLVYLALLLIFIYLLNRYILL